MRLFYLIALAGPRFEIHHVIRTFCVALEPIDLRYSFDRLSGIAQELPAYDPEAVHLSRLTRDDVHRVAQTLITSPRAEREKHGALHPGRVDVIGAGALVVEALADELHARAGIEQVVVSEHDILDGIARSIA